MLTINLRRPKFPYFWLVSASASLLVWPIILIALVNLPVEIQIMHWQPEEFLPISPTFLLDRISWPFALALATLNLAVVLTAVAFNLEQPCDSIDDHCRQLDGCNLRKRPYSDFDLDHFGLVGNVFVVGESP